MNWDSSSKRHTRKKIYEWKMQRKLCTELNSLNLITIIVCLHINTFSLELILIFKNTEPKQNLITFVLFLETKSFTDTGKQSACDKNASFCSSILSSKIDE